MHGQPGRQTLTRAIAGALGPLTVIETGTYRGTTTQFLWDITGVPVWTAEINPRYAAFAKRRFQCNPQIHVVRSDPRAFLARLADDSRVSKEHTLFYLDAHWQKDLPLRDEVSIILHRWRHFVVMIDDFEVPDDDGYAFDDYGPRKRLTLSYLQLDAATNVVPLYPALRSRDEGGRRRGCVVITRPNQADHLLAHGVPLRRDRSA
jgi:hypothetical protein